MRANAIALVAVTLLSSPALAVDGSDSALAAGGVSFTVGGGVGGFTREAMRDVAGPAAGWEARLVIGSHRVLALELAYVGGLQALDMIPIDDDAQLVSSALDATLRLNLLAPIGVSPLQPYLFAGAGWRHYDVLTVVRGTTGIASQDEMLELPVGGGIDLVVGTMIFGVRATYRPAWGADLFAEGEDGGMASWDATVQLGWTL